MKVIQLHLHGAPRMVTYMFRDHALADLGYEKIKVAMAAAREFGNDKDASLSVKGDGGAEFTLKVAHISAAGCEEPTLAKELHIEHLTLAGEMERVFRVAAGIKIE